MGALRDPETPESFRQGAAIIPQLPHLDRLTNFLRTRPGGGGVSHQALTRAE